MHDWLAAVVFACARIVIVALSKDSSLSGFPFEKTFSQCRLVCWLQIAILMAVNMYPALRSVVFFLFEIPTHLIQFRIVVMQHIEHSELFKIHQTVEVRVNSFCVRAHESKKLRDHLLLLALNRH